MARRLFLRKSRAMTFLAVFWRTVVALFVLGLLGLIAVFALFAWNEPIFERTPTAGLQAMGLAAWDRETEASICDQTRARALHSNDREVAGWARRHPCPAGGDSQSASSKRVGAALNATLAAEASAKQAAQRAAKQAESDARAEHEATRPAECRDWKQPRITVDRDGASLIPRADLELARRCQNWESLATPIISRPWVCPFTRDDMCGIETPAGQAKREQQARSRAGKCSRSSADYHACVQPKLDACYQNPSGDLDACLRRAMGVR